MTATTSDEAALCAAIRAAPDEDTPRLMYADWLDENPLDVTVPCPKCENSGEPGWRHRHGKHGPGYYVCEGCADIDNGDPRGTGTATVRDESRRVRAELIRVQVELAQINAAPIYTVELRSRFLSLSPRESALAARLAAEWPGVPPACPVCRGQKGSPVPHRVNCEHCSGTGRVGSWVRGMASVPVPTPAAVFATDPHGFDFEGPDVGVDWSGRNGFACCCRWAYSRHGDTCPEHGKKGKPLLTPWARTELLARPWVCEVPILDREPSDEHGAGESKALKGKPTWDFFSEEISSRDNPWSLPTMLFDALAAAFPDNLMYGGRGVEFSTPAAARMALGRAVAQAAFAEAGSRPGG